MNAHEVTSSFNVAHEVSETRIGEYCTNTRRIDIAE